MSTTEISDQPVGKVAAAAADAQADSSNIFGIPAFRKLFFGSFIGVLGDRLCIAALGVAAFIIFKGVDGGSVEDKTGQIQVWATIPLLLFYGLAGALVDRFDRRKLLWVVKLLKLLSVIPLIFLLKEVVTLDPNAPDLVIKNRLIALWPYCLLVIALMHLITVPFGPARAAAVPDVVPERHQSLAASLMATSGLLAMLVGVWAGTELSRTDKGIGPALTIIVACVCYALSALLFSRLPDNVAVPGTLRHGNQPSDVPSEAPSESYFEGLWVGLKYCCRRASILGLIFFECTFWTLASAFHLLFIFHARTVFNLLDNELAGISALAYPVAGVGLFVGAIGAGKISNKVSPIVTYTPAFLLMTIGLYAIFQSSAAAGGGAPAWIYPFMLCLGLGGGAILGRVDADVLAVTENEPQLRGRVFSIKALAFAVTIMATLIWLSDPFNFFGGLRDEQKSAIALWLPRLFLMLVPIAFAFSWVVDTAIWGHKSNAGPQTLFHTVWYRFLWVLMRLIFKILFRYEVVGAEKIPQSGPVILAANHASFIDPLLLGCSTPRIVQFIMYSSYYKSLGHPIFRFLRCIPVDETQRTAALKTGMRTLEHGAIIGIFPEGHVSHDGKLSAAQGGALFLAQRAGCPVVPVAMVGNYAAFPRHAWIPRFSKVKLIVGDPFIVPKDISKKQYAEISDQMMEDLAKKLGLEPPPRTADLIAAKKSEAPQ